MKIKVHQVPEEGLHLEGEEDSKIIDLNEPLYRFEQPIRYEFDLNWVGDRSLLIRGQLSTVVRAQCVRTLDWFDLPVVVKDFNWHGEQVGDEVDLTAEIREDILLLLPTNPISPEAKPLPSEKLAKPDDRKEVWGKLDQLKLK
jgi:uncharacterized metal-binding protein YceD (DUF177 family)